MKKYIFILLILITFMPRVKATEVEDQINSLNNSANSLNEEVNNLNNNDCFYPIGSIYITINDTNPGNTLCGTWEAYSTGRNLIGVGSNGTTNYSFNDTGGSSTKTLEIANIPSHSHTIVPSGTISNTFTGTAATTNSSGGHSHTAPWHTSNTESSGYGMWEKLYMGRILINGGSITSTSAGAHSHTLTATGTVNSTFTGTAAYTDYQGSATAFSVQNPYITVYMWKRTA